MEHLLWERLYAQVAVLPWPLHLWSKMHQRVLRQVRSTVCAERGIAEEAIQLALIGRFFRVHGACARLTQQYPTAVVVKEPLSSNLIQGYRSILETVQLPHMASAVLRARVTVERRAVELASAHGCIAQPVCTRDAANVAAYAMSKCSELFRYRNRLFPRGGMDRVSGNPPNAYSYFIL